MTLRTWLIAGGVGVTFLLSILACTLWQNRGLRAENQALLTDLGQVTAANSAQQSVIAGLRKQDKKKNDALMEAAANGEQHARRADYLNQQLRRALKSAQKSSDGSALPRAVTDAFCLRWLSAEDRIPHDYLFPSPGQSLAGRDDSIARFCSAWNGLTAQGAMIWAGKLVDQVGEFKIRVRAASAAQGSTMGKDQ